MIHNNLVSRKSIVCFDPKPIDAEKIKRLFEAARWSASSSNIQPWSFIVGQKPSDSYSKILKSLTEPNQLWAKNAPLLLVSVAQMVTGPENRPNKYAWHDCGMAYSNLVFQAISEGLMTHPMAGFSAELIKNDFQIPLNYEPVIAVAIGYESNCSGMPDEIVAKSKRERKRKEIFDFVFGENWQTPYFK